MTGRVGGEQARTRLGETPGRMVLRIGVIHDGRIVEERLIRRGSDVTIGAGADATIQLVDLQPGRAKPLFADRSDQVYLLLDERVQGKVAYGGVIRPLTELADRATHRRGALWLPLDQTVRGKLRLADVTLLFQFVDAPPEPRRAAVSFQPWSIEQVDWLYVCFFLLSCILNGSAYLYIQSQPAPASISLDDIPDYIVNAMYQEPPVEDPDSDAGDATADDGTLPTETDDPESDQDADAESSTEPEPPVDPEERRAQQRAAMAAQGLAAAIATTGNTTSRDTVADLLADSDGLASDLDEALGRSSGITLARWGAEDSLREGGAGSGRVGSITDMTSLSGGDAGRGDKTQRSVSVSFDETPRVSGDGARDVETIQAYVRRKKGMIQACYEAELKTEPDLAGRVEVTWTVLPDGSVTGAFVTGNDTGNDDLASCIVRRINHWSFPEGTEEYDVTYPFILGAG